LGLLGGGGSSVPSGAGGGGSIGGAVTNVGSQSVVVNVSAQNFDENFVRTDLIPLLERYEFDGYGR